MRSAVVERPGAPVTVTASERPSPGPGQALVRVAACGVCHTDLDIAAGRYDWARFPLVPGHEIAGTVAALGPGVAWPAPGASVGLTWVNRSCGRCAQCIRGDTVLCRNTDSTGVNVPGGYQDYVIASAERLIPLPAGLDLVAAAPLMCAGLTSFGGLKRVGDLAGKRLAVLGFGGLGRYAALYAAAMGARVAVVTGSPAKHDAAMALGAELFVAARGGKAAPALRNWEGGPDVVISTVPDADSVSELVDCIAPDGHLVVLGIGETPLRINTHTLVDNRLTVHGSPLGSAKEALALFALVGRLDSSPPVIPVPLDDVAEAMAMTADGADGRVVLVMDQPAGAGRESS